MSNHMRWRGCATCRRRISHVLRSLGEGAEDSERGLGRQTTPQAIRVEYRAVEDFILERL